MEKPNVPLKRFLWAKAVVLVLFVAGAPRSPAQDIRSLEGVVLESGTDRPLEGVKVSASTAEVKVSGITDSNGRFQIAIPRPGRYSVVPSLKGFVYARPARIQTGREAGVWVQIAAGRTVPHIEMRMAKSGAIVGKVLTGKGEPLPGIVASVTLSQYIYDGSGLRTLGNVPGLHFTYDGSFVRMDDRGEYRFYDVPPGDYYVQIGGAGAVGENVMYYPGTRDETLALPVHIGPGEEVRLNTITLPPKRGTDVRLHFPNPAEPQVFQNTIIQYGRGSLFGSRKSVDGEDEITIQFAPGHYDLFVGAAPIGSSSRGRSVPDALFGRISLDVGDSPIDRQVVMSRGLKVNGNAVLVSEAGVRSPVALFPPTGGLQCRLISDSDPSLVVGGSVCFGMQFPAGKYRLELSELPVDQYLQSATIGDRDVLADGIQLQGDVDLQIVLATPGEVLEGVVKDAAGEKLSDAVVVLVPDQPYRLNGGPRYRSTISDVSGNFELRGIAPGNYHLFAWPDLEGAAYRNAEFMKKYVDKGKAIQIEKGSRSVTEVTSEQ